MTHEWSRPWLLAVLLALAPATASAQLAADNVDPIILGKQFLDGNDLWSAKDQLERAQLSNPSAPELPSLLHQVYARLAVQALANRQPTESLAFAEKALAIKPDVIELEYTRARDYEDLKDLDNAIAGYEKTIQLQGGDFKNSQERVIYLYKLRGQAFLQKSDLNGARTDFLNLIRFAPRDTDANYYLGYIAYRMQQYDVARTYLDVSVEEPRLQRLSQMYRGMVEAETRQWQATVKWMTEARKDESLRPQTDPYLAGAYYEIGKLEYDGKRYDAADANFQDVLRLEPQHKAALFYLGMTWDQKGDLMAARDYYTRVRNLEPGYTGVEERLADVDYRIGLAHYKDERIEKAFDMFTEAASLDASRGEPHYYLGLIQRRWKDDNKALPEFETSIRLAQFVLESRFEAGEILFLKEQWAKSIAYLAQVERSNAAYRADKVKSYLRESWWKLAMSDIQTQQWAAATEKLKTVLKYPPDLPQTHYYLGLAALRLGYFDTAVAELEPTYKAQPKDIDTRKALSEAHYQLGLAAFAGERYKDADKEFVRANEVNPGVKDVEYQLARTWNRLERFREAIPYLEKLALVEPPFRDSPDDLAESYGGYGEQLIDQKKRKDATVYLGKSLKLNPGELRALYGMGAIAVEEKRYGDAVGYLRQVHDRSPEYRRTYPMLIETHWNLGKTAYDKKNNLEANRNLEAVVDLDPNHGDALYYLGDLAVQAKNNDAAKSYFERAINRRTKVTESHYGLGTVLFDEGNFEEAVEHFDEVAKEAPTYANIAFYQRRSIYNAADKLYKAGREIDAAIYYEKFFKLEPKNADIAIKLAGISEKAGLDSKAMDWYETAIPLLKSDPDPVRFKLAMLAFKNQLYDRALRTADHIKSGEAKELKGAIYLAMGKRDRAAGNLQGATANLKMALLIMPDNANAMYEYGMLRFSQEQWADAAQYLRKAADKNPNLTDAKKKTSEALRKVAADLFLKERLNDADQAYKTANLYDPNIEADYYIAVIAYQKKDVLSALDMFEDVSKRNPKFLAVQNYLRDSVCELGAQAEKGADLEAARGYLTRCLTFNQSDRDLRFRIAVLSFKLKDWLDARKRFKDLVLNSKENQKAKEYLVDTLFALHQQTLENGSFNLAKNYAAEILEQEPESVRARLGLALSLEKMEDLDEAETAFRAVLDKRPGETAAVDGLRRVQDAKAALAAKPKPAN